MPAAAPPTVLLVSADAGIGSRLREASAGAGWELMQIEHPARVEALLHPHDVRVVILPSDPGVDDLIRLLVRDHPALMVLVWSLALGSDQIADVLEAGAQDVLTARMHRRELTARISRCAGASASASPSARRIGDLLVDPYRGASTWHDIDLGLTGRELDMLDVLVGDVNRTLRREVIYRRVWGHAMARGDRNVDVNIKRLREKLVTATGNQVRIETVSGVGYRIEVDEDDPTATTRSTSTDAAARRNEEIA